MQLVLLLTDKSISEQVKNTLNKGLECNLIEHNNPKDFIALYEIIPDVAAVICDDGHVNEIGEFFQQKEIHADLIYLGKNRQSINSINFHQVDPKDDLINYLKEHLNHKCIPIYQNEDYRQIPISYIDLIQTSPADFYLRVERENFYHYIKVIKKYDEIDKEFLNNKKTKGVIDLYVNKDDKPHVIKMFNEMFLSILQDKNLENKKFTKEEMHKIVFSLLTTVGVSEKSVELAVNTLNDLKENMQKGLLKTLNKMFSTNGPLSYKRSYMTSLILVDFAKQFSWITEQNKEALLLCSMFSDIALKKEDMHFIRSQEDLTNSAEFDNKDTYVIDRHAEIASQWIEKQKDIPAEASRLIRQHHGSTVGRGFKLDFDSNITKLSQFYIVCEEFAFFLLENEHKKVDIVSGIKKIKTKFSSKTVHQFADNLLEHLKKDFQNSLKSN